MGNAYEKRVSKKQRISSTLAKIGEREQRKPRKGGRKRMLRRFGAAPAARLRAVSIYYSRFIVSRGERERDTVNPSDNPGVWPYYISRSERRWRGGKLLLADIILTAALHGARFSRSAAERAREPETRTRDNEFPGKRRLCAAGASDGTIEAASQWIFPHEWNRASYRAFPAKQKRTKSRLSILQKGPFPHSPYRQLWDYRMLDMSLHVDAQSMGIINFEFK